jgi:FxsC-like protein
LYADEGLYFLRKVRSEENVVEYSKFVQRLSDRVVEEADPDMLPPLTSLRSLKEELNAFRPAGAAGAKGAGLAAIRGGPSAAQFVYVAGRHSEFDGVRDKVECYGEEGHEWRPYYPDFEKPVWFISQSVATTENLQYERLCMGEDFINRLRAAEEKNIIVIVVVDPWSIQVESYRQKMREFDRRDFLNCGILIPWNDRDEETSRSIDALQRGVQTTFERKFFLNPTYFRGGIRSPEELQKEICDTINEVRARLIKRAEIKSPLTGVGGHIPLLSNAAAPPTTTDSLPL